MLLNSVISYSRMLNFDLLSFILTRFRKRSPRTSPAWVFSAMNACRRLSPIFDFLGVIGFRKITSSSDEEVTGSRHERAWEGGGGGGVGVLRLTML